MNNFTDSIIRELYVLSSATDHLGMSYDTQTPLIEISGDKYYKLRDKHAPANTPTSHVEPLSEPQLDPDLLDQGDGGFGGPPLASEIEHVFIPRTDHTGTIARANEPWLSVVRRGLSSLNIGARTFLVRALLGENRRITCVFPYPDDAVRHMLYTRLFNNGYGPSDLSPDDAAEMFVYRGKSITGHVICPFPSHGRC